MLTNVSFNIFAKHQRLQMAKIKPADQTSKRDIIYAVAAQLFREKGFRATSMRELAAKVGIEAASLYNHIQGKNDLLNGICFKIATTFIRKMEEVESEDCPMIEKIERLLRFHVYEMVNNYEDVYVSDREWRNMEEPELTKYREMRRSYRKRFAAIVEKGISRGEIKRVDANTTVMIFLNAISAVDQWHRIVHKVNSTELENVMVSVLIEGLRN